MKSNELKSVRRSILGSKRREIRVGDRQVTAEAGIVNGRRSVRVKSKVGKATLSIFSQLFKSLSDGEVDSGGWYGRWPAWRCRVFLHDIPIEL